MKRFALVITLALAAFACGDDAEPSEDDNTPPALGNSLLERPHPLPRPPSGGLPDDMRPPR